MTYPEEKRMRHQPTMLALAAGVMILTQGCASIINRNHPVSITSEPAGAKVTIYDKAGRAVYQGTTPTMVALKRYVGYFSAPRYTVEFDQAGSEAGRGEIAGHVSGWYIVGNLFFGGLIGYLIVDPLTGAMWTFEDLHVNLAWTSPPTGAAWRTLDPPSLRSQTRRDTGEIDR